MRAIRTPPRVAEQGFTLLEIMIVVVIIGLLVAAVAPRFMGQIDTAAINRARSDLRSIETALNLYRLDNFRYPSTSEGLAALVSNPGEGSEISLMIPLTLAIIDGLLVRVGTGRYVIPLAAVEECLELSLEDDMRSRGRSFISLRDSLVPFIRLRDLFNTGTKPDPFQKVVVISTGSERVGLVVDQIIGDHQTVIKAMSKLHDDVATFSGATILGDGSVALILVVAHLVAAGQQQEAHLRAAG